MNKNNKTIVLFGDSLLGRFGKSLIEKLEEKTDHAVIVNCATGGFTSDDGRRRAEVISKLTPDYVILSFGANDVAPWKKQTKLDDFESNIEQIIGAFSKSKIIVFVCPPAKIDDKNLNTEFNSLLQKYNSVLKKIALYNSAQIVELNKVEGNLLKNGNDYHLGDGIHLNPDGYEIFIEEVSKLI